MGHESAWELKYTLKLKFSKFNKIYIVAESSERQIGQRYLGVEAEWCGSSCATNLYTLLAVTKLSHTILPVHKRKCAGHSLRSIINYKTLLFSGKTIGHLKRLRPCKTPD